VVQRNWQGNIFMTTTLLAQSQEDHALSNQVSSLLPVVAPAVSADEQIAADAEALSAQLAAMRSRFFPPAAQKQLRTFSSGEAAKLIGVSDGYLRQLSLSGEGPQPDLLAGGRRAYSLAKINGLRAFLEDRNDNQRNDRQRSDKPTSDKPNAGQSGPRGTGYVRHRNAARGEACQIIAVTNFKGGSGKTTTAVHLAQHLALEGYRVLAVDLDPQASLSALFGYQPELDLTGNDTLYGAIRYDTEQRALRDIIRKTYFDGLDLVPGNLELQEFEHTTPQHLQSRAAMGATGENANRDSLAGSPFFARISAVLGSVANDYDVIVIDCPPQLGFLTLGALCAATSVLVTVHPQMLDVASMSQFLFMTADLLSVVKAAGGAMNFAFLRYLITRYEPNDGPQTQISAFLRGQFGNRVLTNPMVKSTAISDAGLTKQTLYEVGRENFTRGTYDRALEALTAVNGEIEALIRGAWGRGAAV
jgi:chromosome partitioning protein